MSLYTVNFRSACDSLCITSQNGHLLCFWTIFCKKEIKCEKNMFLKIEFSDQLTIKDLSNYQSQEAKVTDDRSVATLVNQL